MGPTNVLGAADMATYMRGQRAFLEGKHYAVVFDWGVAEWVVAVFFALSLILSAANHGKPIPRRDYNFWRSCVMVAIWSALFHYGGFW